jgi:hypothetical protein
MCLSPRTARCWNPVADALKKSLQAMRLQQPKMVYMGNVTGRALRSAEAKQSYPRGMCRGSA